LIGLNPDSNLLNIYLLYQIKKRNIKAQSETVFKQLNLKEFFWLLKGSEALNKKHNVQLFLPQNSGHYWGKFFLPNFQNILSVLALKCIPKLSLNENSCPSKNRVKWNDTTS
jgi:hypothetical protein